MLKVIDLIIGEAPDYEDNGMVACPINAMLVWPMNTAAGLEAFSNPKVNSYIKKILDSWGDFLTSPDSCYMLDNSPTG